MVADKQSSTAFGNVIAANDSNAVERPCERPEHEPQQGIRQEPHCIKRPRECKQDAKQKNLQRIESGNLYEKIMNRPNQENANERKQIRRCQEFAFFVASWPMLQQSCNRHDKKTTRKTEQSQARQCLSQPGGDAEPKA